MSKWTSELIKEIMSDKENYRADYEKTYADVSKSDAVYMDAPVPYHYIPRIYEEKDIENFEEAMANMFSVVNTTIDAYLKDGDIRQLYDFDPRLEELILLDHGYETKVPMGRFDIFYYDDGSYMFCELNTDGSSAMNEEAELSRILQDNLISKHIKETHDLEAFELFTSWVEEVKTIYKEFRHVEIKEQKPHVAIVDFVDKGASLEFQVFQEHFKKNGFECSIVDPRHITCENGYMTYEGQKIDIVYRRLVTKDLMDRYEEIPGFIEGLKAQKTCVIGSLKSQVVHTKLFFAMLYHDVLRKYFSESQLSFIDKTIPYTQVLSVGMADDAFIQNKDQYILKPIDYYASKGVIAGEGTSEEEWRQLLAEKRHEPYLIQKYCPLALRESLLPNDQGGFDQVSFRTITGMYVYNEKVKGIYSRAGLNAIISGIHSGYTLSSLVARKK
jgi:glutathionylspermidine synthase